MDDLILGMQKGQRQARKERQGSFTPKRRQRFLDALALTCNVKAAADFAEVSQRVVYRCRARDPQFMQQWREALEAGYDRLESLALEHGGAGVALEPADPERAATEIEAETGAPPPFDFDKAMILLRHHRASRHKIGKAPGIQRRAATREETNDALIKAIAAAKKRLVAGDDA